MAVPKSKSSIKKKKNRLKVYSFIHPINTGIVGKTMFNIEMYHIDDTVSSRPYSRMSKDYKTRITNRDELPERKRKIRRKYYYRLK